MPTARWRSSRRQDTNWFCTSHYSRSRHTSLVSTTTYRCERGHVVCAVLKVNWGPVPLKSASYGPVSCFVGPRQLFSKLWLRFTTSQCGALSFNCSTAMPNLEANKTCLLYLIYFKNTTGIHKLDRNEPFTRLYLIRLFIYGYRICGLNAAGEGSFEFIISQDDRRTPSLPDTCVQISVWRGRRSPSCPAYSPLRPPSKPSQQHTNDESWLTIFVVRDGGSHHTSA